MYTSMFCTNSCNNLNIILQEMPAILLKTNALEERYQYSAYEL